MVQQQPIVNTGLVQLTQTVSETKTKTVRTIGPKVSAQLAMDLNPSTKDQIAVFDTDDDSNVNN